MTYVDKLPKDPQPDEWYMVKTDLTAIWIFGPDGHWRRLGLIPTKTKP